MDSLNVEFPDDFEEFRARANSGGSLYGIFRRRVISSSSSHQNANANNKDSKPQRPLLPKPFKRQRSRSLITCSPTLADDKYVLLALFDYAEARRHQTEIRRHSTAVDGRDLRKVVLTNSLNRNLNLRPPDPGSDGGDKPDSNLLRPDAFITAPGGRKNSTTILVPPTSRKNSISLQVPPTSRKNSLVLNAPSRKNSIHSIDPSAVGGGLSLGIPQISVRKYSLPRVVLNDGADDQAVTVEEVILPAEELSVQPPGGVNMQRRRSFTITPDGIKNQGDIILPPPSSPTTFLNMATQPPEPPSPDPITSPDSEFVLSIPVPVISLPQPPIIQKSDSIDSVIDSAECMRIDTEEPMAHDFTDDVTIGDDSEETWVDVPVYRVLTLGGPGVGKTALTQQFMTSEYMAAQNTSFDDGIECCVPVLLDGEEYIMEFIDLPYTGNNIWKDYEVDAYLVVFSITDRRSFQKADDFVYDVRKEGHTSEAVIIVANKSDLVRGRLVAEEEARQLADNYDCKFIEVSAILNHKVDDLLVGILKQIRLNYEAQQPVLPETDAEEGAAGPRCSSRCVDDSGCMTRTKEQVLGKFFKPRLSRSCENLLDL